MKKQILSDLLIASSTIKMQIVICIAVGVFVSIACDSIIAALTCTFAIFAFGHCIGMPLWDGENNWQVLRMAMPYSRKEIVLGRFVSALVFMAIALVCGLVSLGLSYAIATTLAGSSEIYNETMGLFAGEPFGEFVMVAALSVAAVASMLLVGNGIQYALSFRFGMEKAGRYIPAAVAIVIAIFIGLSSVIDFGSIVVPIFETNPLFIGVGMLVLALAVYGICLMLSLRWYETREL